MADVLIRGMEKMPGNCRECMFAGFGGMRNELNVCMFSGESQSLISHERMSKCPLVPLPEGHGRLIDADALQKSVLSQCEMVDAFGVPEMSQIAELIKNGLTQEVGKAETIIEAEGGGEQC